FQAEDGIRDRTVTGVQTCALPISDDKWFTGDSYLLLLLATVVYVYGGKPFIVGAAHELRSRNPGMMTLVAVAITVAFAYSAAVEIGRASCREGAETRVQVERLPRS